MNKRFQYVGVGTAMAAMLGVGSLTGHGASVFAQSATPTPPAAAAGAATTKAAARKAEYDAFVAKLATQLGIGDPTKVDAAIKAVLKQQVDDQFTAGNISQNQATAIKARIDAGDVGPLGFGHGMGMDGGRMRGHGGKDGNDAQNGGDVNGQGGNDTENGGSDNTTPDATPAATN